MTQQLKTLTEVRPEFGARYRALMSQIEHGSKDALRALLELVHSSPSVQKIQIQGVWTRVFTLPAGWQKELRGNLTAFLQVAEQANDRGRMRTVLQLAALLGDQDLLLAAQEAMVPKRDIHLEGDEWLLNPLQKEWDFSTAKKGEWGVETAGTPTFKGQPGDLLRSWEEAGLMPDEEDVALGISRADLGIVLEQWDDDEE